MTLAAPTQTATSAASALTGGWAEAAVRTEIYPSLLRRGIDIPLGLALDLARFFTGAQNADPSAPRGGSAELTTAYAAALNHVARCRSFQVTTAQARRETDGGSPESLKASLGGFLEIAALHVASEVQTAASSSHSASSQDQFRATLPPSPGGVHVRHLPTLAGFKGSDDDYSFLSSWSVQFLEVLLKDGKGGDRLGRAFDAAGFSLLAIAGGMPAGAQGIDFFVLNASLNYRPLALDARQSDRWLHVRRSIPPRQNHRDRSPECGNHGVTTRGGLPTVLRSFLARDDFDLRLLSGELLYVNRYAPREEPRNILLAFAIDRGIQMQRRALAAPRCRLDAIARQLAACVIEDVVREISGVTALNLRVVVLLHNGDGSDFQAVYLDLLPELLLGAPQADRSSKQAVAWLPKVPGFLRHYYVREPRPEATRPWRQWPDPLRKGTSTAPSVTLPSAADWALRKIADLAAIADPDSADVTAIYDLCNIVMFRPEGESPRGLDPGNFSSATLCLHEVIVNQVELEWRSGSNTKKSPSTHSLDDHPIRKAMWDDLVKQLAAI